MKLLILGATGMLGHKLALKLCERHEVWATVRGNIPDFFRHQKRAVPFIFEGVDASDMRRIEAVIAEVKPTYVINCIGIVKQLATASDPLISISINALFPHQLENLSHKYDFRLIHFSTDCVFSGKAGPYALDAPSDVNDLYGMTKFLGEVRGDRALTIRSSIIGREFTNPTGLVEWFLSQKGGRVKGFRHALYTGLPTNTMADLLEYLITTHPQLHGLYQVAAPEISKFELLGLINQLAETGITIEEDRDFFCDRRLDGSIFHNATNWAAPSWKTMLKTMFDEDERYYITSQ